MRRLIILVAILGLVVTGANADTLTYEQNFETDAADWNNYNGGSISQVATGTNGITSASGSGHAEISLAGDSTGNSYGGGAYTFGPGKMELFLPGFETFIQYVDVYIDPAVGVLGDTWQMSTAIYSPEVGGYVANEGFNAVKLASGAWSLSALNDGGLGLVVETAGWYTLESNWNEITGSDAIARDSYIYNSVGTQVYALDRPDKTLSPSDTTYTTGYEWFFARTANDMTLAIDNVQYLYPGEPVPEPASMALLGLGLAGLSLRRSRKRA